MEYPLPADMGDAGVDGVVALVSYGLGWICRPQPTAMSVSVLTAEARRGNKTRPT